MYNTHLTFLLIVVLFNLSSTDNLLKTRKLSDILTADPWDTYDIYVLAYNGEAHYA